MSRIFGALEKMESAVGLPSDTGDFNQVILQAKEYGRLFTVANRQLSAVENLIDNANKVIGELSNFRAVIKKYGISKPVMLVADPRGELIQMGIVGSYEELEDTPVKDETADEVVAKLDKTIEESIESVSGGFKLFKSKLSKFFDAIGHGFNSYMKAITASIQKMNVARANDTTISTASANVISKDDFMKVTDSTIGLLEMFKGGTLGNVVEKVGKILAEEIEFDSNYRMIGPKNKSGVNVDKLIAAIKEVRTTFFKEARKFDPELVGISIDESFDFENNSSDVDIRLSGFAFKRVKSSLGNFGWKKADIEKAADKTKTILKLVNELDSTRKKATADLGKLDLIASYKWTTILALVGFLLGGPLAGVASLIGALIGFKLDSANAIKKLGIDSKAFKTLRAEINSIYWVMYSTYYGIRAAYINAQSLSNLVIDISKAAAKA